MAMIGTPRARVLAAALRKAATHPRAPRRLQRAADAVLDGKFSWEDVVQGTCTHPYAMSLFTRGAEREMWPQVLRLVDRAEQAPARRKDENESTERGETCPDTPDSKPTSAR